MNKRKKIEFFVLLLSNILLALADGGLTYLNTPDLAREGNPLVAKLGLGWGALFLANFVVMGFMFFGAYYCFFRYETIYSKETKFTRYASLLMYNRPDKFWTGLLPKNPRVFVASVSYITCYGLLASRAILVTEWLYITYNNWLPTLYSHIRRTYFFGRTDLIIAIIVAYVAYFLWFYREFKAQLSPTTERTSDNV